MRAASVVGGVVAVAAVAAAVVVVTDDGGGPAEDPQPVVQVSDGDGGPLPFAQAGADALSFATPFVRTGGEPVPVSVDPPEGAVEMMVSADPSFAGQAWGPARPGAQVSLDHVGRQMAYARFRDAEGTVSMTSVAAVDVTSTATLTGPDGTDLAPPVQVGLLAEAVLQVRLLTDLPADRDPLGLSPDGLNPDRLVVPESWSLRPPEGSVTSPVTVDLVVRPAGSLGQERTDEIVATLTFAQPLSPDIGYELVARGMDRPFTFRLDPTTTRSPAIHTTQVGYRPDDPGKVALLSAWTGGTTAPDYAGRTFEVHDVASGEVVHTGEAVLRLAPGAAELPERTDLTGTTVYALDFSSVTAAGAYRVCVPGLGCSADVLVHPTRTWQQALVTVARGLYHNRSGIALGPPWTAVERPRPFHPEDGTEVVASTERLLDNANGPLRDRELFAPLVAGATGETVPEAWGGHFDAGDWDRRVQHLFIVGQVVDLLELWPEALAGLELNIPESGDAVPDLLDEVLWSVDLYRRLQHEDGSVPGGIETAAGPQAGTTSWTDTQTAYVYAPDPWSTFIYAGAAARVAVYLQDVDPERAQSYRDSALAAAGWAAEQPAEPDPDAAAAVADQRMVAAAALFRLTGDPTWETAMAEVAGLVAGPVDSLVCTSRPICDAAWTYLRADEATADPAIRANAVDSVVTTAADRLADADGTGYGWAVDNPFRPLITGGGPSVPKVEELVRGFVLTGDPAYRRAAVMAGSFALGANPLDTSFVTGLGQRNPRYPLIVDVEGAEGLPLWPGVPVYGVHDLNRDSREWFLEALTTERAMPDPLTVPVLNSWYDIQNYGPMAEFTVAQTFGASIFAYGALAAMD